MKCKYIDCSNYSPNAKDYCCGACACDDYDYHRLYDKKKVAAVTPTVCVDGKRHYWKDLEKKRIKNSNTIYWYWHCWCSKCGCLTQFYKSTPSKSKKRRRYLDFQDKPVLTVHNYLYRKQKKG